MWGQEPYLLQWVLGKFTLHNARGTPGNVWHITVILFLIYLSLLALFLVAAFTIATVEGRNLNAIMGQKERFSGPSGCFQSLTMINHRL